MGWAKVWRHEHAWWPFQRPVRSVGWLEVEGVWKQPEMVQSSDHSNFGCVCGMLRDLGFILNAIGKWKDVKQGK